MSKEFSTRQVMFANKAVAYPSGAPTMPRFKDAFT